MSSTANNNNRVSDLIPYVYLDVQIEPFAFTHVPPLLVKELTVKSLGVHHYIFSGQASDIAVRFLMQRLIDLTHMSAPGVTGRASICIRALGKVPLTH